MPVAAGLNQKNSTSLTLGTQWDTTLEVVSKPQIRPKSKAQTDEKAEHTRQYVSILKRLAMHLNLLIIDAESRYAGQHSYWASDGVLKPLLDPATTPP
jgi:hypothetical protein